MIVIPVSLGELMDKISILEIKMAMVKDEEQFDWIRDEWHTLIQIRELYVQETGIVLSELLSQKLYALNLTLWNLHNDLRQKMQAFEYDEEFTELTVALCHTNDLRADLKDEITALDDSPSHREMKSYT